MTQGNDKEIIMHVTKLMDEASVTQAEIINRVNRTRLRIRLNYLRKLIDLIDEAID